jgi:hypothetical protein
MLTFSEIKVAPGLKFKDISDEIRRTYIFADQIVNIMGPIALRVSDSGGHYVIDIDGLTHYIPPYWGELIWENKPNTQHVRF